MKKNGTKVNEFADQADLQLKTEMDDFLLSTEEQRVTTKKQNQLLRKAKKELAKRKIKKEEIMQAEDSLFDEGWQGLDVCFKSFITAEAKRGVESIKVKLLYKENIEHCQPTLQIGQL